MSDIDSFYSILQYILIVCYLYPIPLLPADDYTFVVTYIYSRLLPYIVMIPPTLHYSHDSIIYLWYTIVDALISPVYCMMQLLIHSIGNYTVMMMPFVSVMIYDWKVLWYLMAGDILTWHDYYTIIDCLFYISDDCSLFVISVQFIEPILPFIDEYSDYYHCWYWRLKIQCWNVVKKYWLYWYYYYIDDYDYWRAKLYLTDGKKPMPLFCRTVYSDCYSIYWNCWENDDIDWRGSIDWLCNDDIDTDHW